ncbi:MAG: hypothetical protein NC086_07695 [Alistipes sp.]|nr:hypothetical protein [Alistipes sp.]
MKQKKQKLSVKQFIAIILAVVILITEIPITTVYAENNDVKFDFWSEYNDYVEEKQEVDSDMVSPVKAGDWRTAIYHDGLAWNFFHNKVQADVVAHNIGKIQKEKKIPYYNEQWEATGKYGKADLYMEILDDVYIWEVKPYSYSVDPKKSAGELQLNKYVNTDPGKFTIGGSQIEGGTIIIPLEIVHSDVTESVEYEITYTVESNGLVLYRFNRTLKNTRPNTVMVPAEVVVKQPSKSEAVDQIVNPGYVSSSTNPGYIPEVSVDLDIVKLMAMVTIANAWGNFHDKINSSPSTNNSLSAAISLECKIFATTVSAKVLAYAFDPETVNAEEINEAMDRFELAMEAYGGDTLIDELMAALGEEDYEKIEELIKAIQGETDEYDKAGKAQPPRDPLVIDIGEEGITLRSINNGVNFDLDNNGFAEKTAWIGKDDGFLAYDRNGNGIIDNGGELFGDQVILSDGSKSVSGFDALADVDENNDGVIDNNDSVFANLLVWIDSNHNGISESDELRTLNELGIVSISLEHTEVSFTDEETGARIAETSNVVINRDGVATNTRISEFWFPINSSDTTQGDIVTAGNVPDINQAVIDDDTGKLAELCYQFGEANGKAEKRYYIKKILYFITNADNIAAESRGGNIDARDLRVIEQFMGREFEGVGGSNPNSNAASILKEIYGDIEDQYYNLLNMYCALGGYMNVVPEYENAEGNKVLDLSFLNYIFTCKINNGENLETLVYDLGVYLNSYDEIHHTHLFNDYKQYYSSISSTYAEIVELSNAGTTYIGTDKNDHFSGSGRNDFVFGEEGDDNLNGGNASDIIYGKAGNDVISGGSGNDRLYGNEGDDVYDGGPGNDLMIDDGGNDTYVFTKGYDENTIIDNGGSNKISFTNLTAKDILVNGTGDYDATIRIKGTNDSLVIKNFCENVELADYTLIFKDKTMHCTDEESPFKHIYGSEQNDVLRAVVKGSIINSFGGNDTVIGSDGRDIIYGNGGNDSITAGEEDDVVYGGADDDYINGDGGNDILWGETGNDTLDGGCGNDYLFGGEGDDTYVFAENYGRDIMEDGNGVSTVKLGGELTMEDISVYRICDEAVIIINGTEDMLIISGYGTDPENYYIEAGDSRIDIGDVITDYTSTVLNDMAVIIGTENSDAIFAEDVKNLIAAGSQYDYIVGSGNEDIIFGDGDTDRILTGAGNEVIYGGDGDDELFGEADNDFVSGGAGNDYINGGDGDDIIIAGTGDDFIEEPSGNDTYYFNAGDGNNSIMDSDGNNTIIFGDNIFSDGIKAYRENWNDLLITFEGLDDTLIIKNYCIDEASRNFKFIFADGSVYYADDEESALRSIDDKQGTEYMPSIYPDKNMTITSSNGNDEITGGEGADTLNGGNGNNRIIGNGGDDVLNGGAGKDYLCGGSGSDTYIYKKGYGSDTISDSEGKNHIEVSGYTTADVMAYRTNWNDITLVFDGSGEEGLYNDLADKIIIEGFFTSESNRNYTISFNGSKYQATAGNSPLRIIYGTVNDDYMQGFDNSNVTMYGGEGADTLNGGNSGDFLYGGKGDDRLLGFAGNDTLNGEAGNDYLEGGAGNDTYIFDIGSGTDTINDNQGVNMICFGEGIVPEGLIAYRTNWNDLTITFAGAEDKLVIQGYFISADNRKFDVKFADGRKYEYTNLESPINRIYASETDDWMSAWSDEGISLNGAAGNDSLTGGAGNDILIGGTGNDTIAGGAGNDIYKYSLGDGSDIITDVEGLNKLVFEDIVSAGVTFSYEAAGDQIELVITMNDTGENIVINNYNADNFIIEFAEGIIGKAVIGDMTVSFIPETEDQE